MLAYRTSNGPTPTRSVSEGAFPRLRFGLVSHERRGVVLLAVLVVVVVLTLAAYQYSEYMQAEYQAANSHSRLQQSKALALSGVSATAVRLSNTDYLTNTLNGNPYSNTELFQDVMVGDASNSRRTGRYSIIGLVSPDDPNFQSTPYFFGVVDEAGKINLNALLQLDSTGSIAMQILLTLPNMTEDLANCILDWLDPSSTTPRTNGAKDEYYMDLQPPYHCKMGPLDSIDELLLVKGVTPQLLYGNDLNQNGILDPNEDDGTGIVDRGWAAYLTIYSREPNADNSGNPRIYLNSSDIATLSTQLQTPLGQDLTNFIIAYRLYGASASAPAAAPAAATPAGGNARTGKGVAKTVNTPAPGTTQSSYTALSSQDSSAVSSVLTNALTNPPGKLTSISSLYALITAKVDVQVPGPNNTMRTVTMSSPLSDPGQQTTLLPLLLDKTTTSQATDLPARINFATASQTVLNALPMLGEADVQAILAARPSWSSMDTAPDPIFSTPAWLITEAKLSPATLQAAERYMTSRTFTYSFQSIGYFDGGGPTTRLEAVIDTNYGRPRIVHLRDLSETGKGFPVPFNTGTAGSSSPSTP
jgi:type II secretory pathway component PulK